MGGSRNQREEDTDNDMHAWEDSYATSDGFVPTDEERFGYGGGMGQSESAVSAMWKADSCKLFTPPSGRSTRDLTGGCGGGGATGGTCSGDLPGKFITQGQA